MKISYDYLLLNISNRLHLIMFNKKTEIRIQLKWLFGGQLIFYIEILTDNKRVEYIIKENHIIKFFQTGKYERISRKDYQYDEHMTKFLHYVINNSKVIS